MTAEFQPFPKLARLNRNIVITEKLDGTNAAIIIVDEEATDIGFGDGPDSNRVAFVGNDEGTFSVYAQSRNKFITPGKSTDNYGFAGWVRENAQALVAALGEGTHFGEWWGAGIQRGYGLEGGDKRLSLFNTGRWGDPNFDNLSAGFERVPGLGVVPTLYSGPFDQAWINTVTDDLREDGSIAAHGFANPEGIVIYHTAARQSFKVTFENDAAPGKTGPRNANDLLPTETIGLAA